MAQPAAAAPHILPHAIGAPLPPRRPSPAAQRGNVVATRTAPGGNAQHPAVFAPWKQLQAKADDQFKRELVTALNELERTVGDAAQMLDRAYATAAEAAGSLEAAAWAAWEKYTRAADDLRNAILTRALAAYTDAFSRAQAAYEKAVTDAENVYKTITADANRAQADVKAMPS